MATLLALPPVLAHASRDNQKPTFRIVHARLRTGKARAFLLPPRPDPSETGIQQVRCIYNSR